MIKKWCIHNKYSIFIILLLISFCGYYVSKSYGFAMYPDEFGYWTYAATLAGYDWSDIVSLGSYYSYGYSLILFPIFLLCKDAVITYRVAIGMNFLLLILCFILIKKLAGKIFCEENEETLTFYAAIAVFYPSLLFYARTTLAEIVIVTLYTAICVLLYNYIENNKMSTLIMLVLALVYIHFIHMRTVAVLIAGALTIICYYLVKKKKFKQTVAITIAFLAVFAVGFFIKEWVTGHLYAASTSIATNDYAGQFGKIVYIFTKEGFRDFMISLSGKILYLGVASFGLAYWGIKHIVKQIYKAFTDYKKGKEIETKIWLYIFLLLSTIGATLVNAIYTIGHGRVDALTYGRYHEYVVPALMIFGIKEVSGTVKIIRDYIVIIVMEIIMTAMVTWSLLIYGQDNIHGYMMVGMSYMHNLNNFEPIPFFWQALCLGAVLMAVVTAIIRLSSSRKGMQVLMAVILIIEFALMLRAGSLYLDESARGAYRDTRIAEKIEELEQTKDRPIYYCVYDNNYDLISVIQFMVRDNDIQIVDGEAVLNGAVGEEALILVDYRDSRADSFEEEYDKYYKNGHFILYYND